MLRVLGCMVFQGSFRSPEVDMKGKTVAITGPTPGGIGSETAIALGSFGARIILGARNLGTARPVADKLGNSTLLSCDLADPKSVSEFADEVKKTLGSERLDVLVCNAGAVMNTYSASHQGVEDTFRIAALAHFFLIRALRPQRTVWVTGDIYIMSKGPADPFLKEGGMEAYKRACLARLLLLREFKDRANDDSEYVAVHPGVIATGLMNTSGLANAFMKSVLISVEQGAQSSIYAASCPTEQLHQDATVPYFGNKHGWTALKETDPAMSKEDAVKLYEICDSLCDGEIPSM